MRVKVTLVIEAGPAGCRPGRLNCVCGSKELAIWTPELGARCSDCKKCFVSIRRVLGLPGIYVMTPGPFQEALDDKGDGWERRKERKAASLTAPPA